MRIEQEYAHLSWFSNVPSRPGLVKCEVVCRPENKESRATEIKNSLPTNWTLLELPELHNNTKYSVFIVCSLDTEVYRSNVVHFVTTGKLLKLLVCKINLLNQLQWFLKFLYISYLLG